MNYVRYTNQRSYRSRRQAERTTGEKALMLTAALVIWFAVFAAVLVVF